MSASGVRRIVSHLHAGPAQKGGWMLCDFLTIWNIKGLSRSHRSLIKVNHRWIYGQPLLRQYCSLPLPYMEVSCDVLLDAGEIESLRHNHSTGPNGYLRSQKWEKSINNKQIPSQESRIKREEGCPPTPSPHP